MCLVFPLYARLVQLYLYLRVLVNNKLHCALLEYRQSIYGDILSCYAHCLASNNTNQLFLVSISDAVIFADILSWKMGFTDIYWGFVM